MADNTSEIKIKIHLGEDRVPSNIEWESSDNPYGKGPQNCKAVLLALFDKETKDTLKIDLWTKEMQVVEMDRFFFQSLRAMADTYFKATNNTKLANEMRQFVQYFGEQTEIIPK